MTPILARLLPLLLLTAALLPVSGAALARDRDYLPPEVEKALKQRKVPGASLSVYVREVGRDEPLVSYNSTVLRNPASTMKVVTTFAALEQLGPAYTWRTRAYAAGPIRDQVLEGNLVLVGGGDPFMSQERWWAFAAGLRQAGEGASHQSVAVVGEEGKLAAVQPGVDHEDRQRGAEGRPARIAKRGAGVVDQTRNGQFELAGHAEQEPHFFLLRGRIPEIVAGNGEHDRE